MQNKPSFLQLLLRPVENGFVLEIETDSEDKTYVSTSARQVLRLISDELGLSNYTEKK